MNKHKREESYLLHLELVGNLLAPKPGGKKTKKRQKQHKINVM
jgi:hypothetical protein